MTVVVVKNFKDKIVIGADSQHSQWSGFKHNHDAPDNAKIWEVTPGWYIGVTGSVEDGMLFREFCGTHHPKNPTKSSIMDFYAEFVDWSRDKTKGTVTVDSAYLMIYEKKIFCIYGFCVYIVEDFYAIGSGQEIATGVLEVYDKSDCVKKAVLAACKYNAYCSEPMRIYEIAK